MSIQEFQLKNQQYDANLVETKALPAAASSAITTDPIFMGAGLEKVLPELELTTPALSATIVPDTRTATLTIEQCALENFGSGVTTIGTLVLTGAAGAGVAASALRARGIMLGGGWFRGKVAFGASTTDGSALSATFRPVF
jgi:hypothetical protein